MFMGKGTNPIFARAMRKVKIILLVWAALEIGIFILLGNLFGFDYAFWILFGFFVLGWIIHSFEPRKKGIDVNQSSWKLIGRLFMIPGYLTSLVAIVFLIPPLRRAAMAFVTKRIIPEEVRKTFSATDPHHFFDFMNGGNVNVDPNSQTSRKHQSAANNDECIDLDGDAYDVKYSGKYQPTARVERKAIASSEAHDAPDNDIIDVEHEFK